MRQYRRLKQTNVRDIIFRPRIVTKDSEGVPVVSWGDPIICRGEIWPATSERQIQEYGDRVSGVQNVHIEGDYRLTNVSGVLTLTRADGSTIHLGDGVHVYTEYEETTIDISGPVTVRTEPDYQVLSIREADPLLLEIEVRYGQA